MNQPPAKPTIKSVSTVITALESQEMHPTRQLARGLVAEYRRGQAINPHYDFSRAPRELRQVIYDGIVRYGAQYSWLAKLMRK